jgi:hypothetical protein
MLMLTVGSLWHLLWYYSDWASATASKKLDPRSVPGKIMGYGPRTKQYRVLVLQSQQYKVYEVRHIIVNAGYFR